jgi:hypothetical protein
MLIFNQRRQDDYREKASAVMEGESVFLADLGCKAVVLCV